MFKDSEETSLAKPGKTSVANQAWTSSRARRQQITDLINDRSGIARLILAPKNLGTKVGCWLEIRCLPFGKDRYTSTVSHFSIQMSNTNAGFLMEIKPSCSLYGVNQVLSCAKIVISLWFWNGEILSLHQRALRRECLQLSSTRISQSSAFNFTFLW